MRSFNRRSLPSGFLFENKCMFQSGLSIRCLTVLGSGLMDHFLSYNKQANNTYNNVYYYLLDFLALGFKKCKKLRLGLVGN